jgi:hypothetical protein
MESFNPESLAKPQGTCGLAIVLAKGPSHFTVFAGRFCLRITAVARASKLAETA